MMNPRIALRRWTNRPTRDEAHELGVWSEWQARRREILADRGEAEIRSWAVEPEAAAEPAAPPDDASQLGAHAKRLLEDPVLALAFARIERDLVASWKGSAVGEQQQRDEAYRLLWALEGVRGKLRGFANNAKLIAAERNRQEAADRREAERRAA